MSSRNTLNALIGQATIALLSINHTLSKEEILLYLSQERDSLRISHFDLYAINRIFSQADIH